MQRHTVTKLFNCATDFTTALVNDAYSVFQVVSNPRWQQRQVNRAKLVIETIITFAVAAWSAYVQWADNFVESRLERRDNNEPSVTITQVAKAMVFSFIADTVNALMPGVRTAIAYDIQVALLSQVAPLGIVTIPKHFTVS